MTFEAEKAWAMETGARSRGTGYGVNLEIRNSGFR
jgi:hypothetical protein